MMRVGWKGGKTHRKIFSHCTKILGAVRVRRATPIFAQIKKGPKETCGCSIEPVEAPEFRKICFKLILPSVFVISAKTRHRAQNLTKISDSLPEGFLVTCECSIEPV